MALQRILCPIDFSPGSNHALQVAARIAKRDRAALVIAHAWYAGEYTLGNYRFPAGVDAILEEERRGLDTVVRDVQKLGVENVSFQLLMGYPWQEITELLRKDPSFDLVVVGTRGRSGLARVVLGSVAEKILRHAPCPVLATRETARDGGFRNVLCAVDFSDSSRQASELASAMVEPDGALALLHVLDPAPITFARESMTVELGTERDVRATQQLDELATELRGRAPVRITTRLAMGSAGAEILRVADELPVDLVVTGSRGRTGLRRALLGSVAEKVVRHAPCPVLVARRRNDE